MGRDNAAERQMTLVAFLQAANCSNYPASWRHPATAPDFLTAAYFQRIARTLEEGKFHLAFCDDRLAMPDRYGDDFATAVRHGIRVVKMDLIPVLTAMGLATRHLGLGVRTRRPTTSPFMLPGSSPPSITSWPVGWRGMWSPHSTTPRHLTSARGYIPIMTRAITVPTSSWRWY